MTSKKRAEEALALQGITPPELSLFSVIHYGLTQTPTHLPSTAAKESYGTGGPVTEEECRVALAACLAKGWLQVIDDRALVKIADELRKGRFLGPIYRLPEVGGVDFTPAGAALWQGLYPTSRPDRPPCAFTDVVHIKTAHYFRTRAAAHVKTKEILDLGGGVTVTGPSPIGPWRAQWWRRYPEGYRIDVEEKMQWQGRCGGSEGCIYMPAPFCRGADPARLRHILDCHNVRLREWLLLAAMEHGWDSRASYLPLWVAKDSTKEPGVTVSEDECRDGLETCLRYGWLRWLDGTAVDEIHALLREAPTLLPVGSEVVPGGDIDFTFRGAALYRMIAAEWLGPDWEDALEVSKEYYREEHRYCEAERGLQGIAQGYMDRGEVVRASKVVSLGPWCVYWWERFPDGYRLELQIGAP